MPTVKVSYPTIRNRLNDIIAKLQPTSSSTEAQKLAILDAAAGGKLSAQKAAAKLQEIVQ